MSLTLLNKWYEFQQSCKIYMKRKKYTSSRTPHRACVQTRLNKKMCKNNSRYTLQRHLAYQNLFKLKPNLKLRLIELSNFLSSHKTLQ